MPEQVRDQVFISYSHKDKKRLDEIQTVLVPLKRAGKLTVWADTDIKAGAHWRDEIKKALECTKVAVLLVSKDFLASDFIAKLELPPLLKAAEEDGATIIWVAVSACLYEETEIAKYQPANDPERPLDGLTRAERHQEWVSIARQIKAAVEIPEVAASQGGDGRAKDQPGESPFQLIEGEQLTSSVHNEPASGQAGVGTVSVVESNRPGLSPVFKRRKRQFIVVSVSLLMVASGVAFYLCCLPGPDPPTPTPPEFTENFDPPDEHRWARPPSGWKMYSNRLHVRRDPASRSVPEIGFLKTLQEGPVNFPEYKIKLHLKLENDGGAAWALRVKDSNNYYLFYLCGSGQDPIYTNKFLTYIVRNGRFEISHFEGVPAPTPRLVKDGEYDVFIKVTNGEIRHLIHPANLAAAALNYSDCVDLGAFPISKDQPFRYGSLGFGTVGLEEFSIIYFHVLTLDDLTKPCVISGKQVEW